MPIKKINARKIEDSRGNPTFEVDIETGKGISRAAAPSGASTGEAEAAAFPESVDFHVRNINNEISSKLIGLEPDLLAIDRLLHDLDETGNFSNIGGNPAGIFHVADDAAFWNAQIDVAHGRSEKITVFGFFNAIRGGPDHFNTIFFQDSSA